MPKATEKRIYLTRHAEAEHKYVWIQVCMDALRSELTLIPPSVTEDWTSTSNL